MRGNGQERCESIAEARPEQILFWKQIGWRGLPIPLALPTPAGNHLVTVADSAVERWIPACAGVKRGEVERDILSGTVVRIG